MVVPDDTTVVLEIVSIDVAHSWWIPPGGKFDAVPGNVNKTWFKAGRGRYRGQCAEFCGHNHADMLATVRVVPAADYERWYDEKAREIDTARRLAAERRAGWSVTSEAERRRVAGCLSRDSGKLGG
jgi:cytochrome c oxidase subunit 2